MKIGSFRTARWRRCGGIACVLWLAIYLLVYLGGGLANMVNPVWWQRVFYGAFGQ